MLYFSIMVSHFEPDLSTVVTVYLSLGSNMGDRAEHLRRAVAALAGHRGIHVRSLSPCYETAPWGVTDQPAFYNLAVEIGTVLSPPKLLNTVKTMEAALGRCPGTHWGPRVIDIDIVLWESLVLQTETLEIPHPRFRERAFVLWPLADIAPDGVDPVSGRTVAALADALRVSTTPHAAQPLGMLAVVS